MATRLPAARRRRQLLDVALEVFAERGFHPTSMNEIAEAAGVTKPVLYRHFGSKRELYIEVLDDVGGRLRAAIEKATSEAATPHQQVVAGFRAYFRFAASQQPAFRALFGGGAGRDEEFADEVRRVESSIAETIASLIDVEGLDTAHRCLLASGIVGLAEGVSRLWLSEGQPGDPDALSDLVAELAWAGLRGIRRS